jgi:hypothetical protein
MVRTKALLMAGFAAMVLGGTLLMTSAPAQAGASTGTWRNGMVAGPYGVGYYRGYGYRPARYGYRPARAYRRYNNGGALAAGLIGGLALGALAAAPAYSYPAYSYPAYSYPAYPATAYPGYDGTGYYGGTVCYPVNRRFVDGWGRVFVRPTQVCE